LNERCLATGVGNQIGNTELLKFLGVFLFLVDHQHLGALATELFCGGAAHPAITTHNVVRVEPINLSLHAISPDTAFKLTGGDEFGCGCENRKYRDQAEDDQNDGEYLTARTQGPVLVEANRAQRYDGEKRSIPKAPSQQHDKAADTEQTHGQQEQDRQPEPPYEHLQTCGGA